MRERRGNIRWHKGEQEERRITRADGWSTVEREERKMECRSTTAGNNN